MAPSDKTEYELRLDHIAQLRRSVALSKTSDTLAASLQSVQAAASCLAEHPSVLLQELHRSPRSRPAAGYGEPWQSWHCLKG